MDNSCCRNVGKISRSELLLLVFRYSRHKLFLITDIFLILEHLNSDCSVSSMGTGFWFNWMHIILHFSKSFDIRSFCSVLLPRVLWPKIWHLQYRPKKKKKKGNWRRRKPLISVKTYMLSRTAQKDSDKA